MTDVSSGRAKVELGEGIHGTCKLPNESAEKTEAAAEAASDVSSLSSMLAAKCKGGGGSGGGSKREPLRAGQIRSFKIVKLDAGAKRIELEMVS